MGQTWLLTHRLFTVRLWRNRSSHTLPHVFSSQRLIIAYTRQLIQWLVETFFCSPESSTHR